MFLGSSLSAADVSGIELTTPVRQSLSRLQDAWQRWTSGYFQDDRDLADTAIDEILAIAEHLGMVEVPDLSVAAAAYAVASAEEGNFPRANWALDAARRLDRRAASTEFAGSVVRWREGRYTDAVAAHLQGYWRLLTDPVGRWLMGQNVALWLVAALMLSGAIFTALKMVFHGEDLLADFERLAPQSFPRGASVALALATLIWPILLPGGVLWLVVYWSVLLWPYGSTSERVVLSALWLLVGVAPLAVSMLQQQVQLAIAPPLRVVDAVRDGRLNGTLFTDLGVLRSLLPDSPSAGEVVADLHRRVGQWEHATSIYRELGEATNGSEGPSMAVSNNLGVYYHRKGDYGAAISFFRAACEADPTAPEPFFNLSQAYSQSYAFSDSHAALARARELDGAGVEAWLDGEGVTEGVVPVDGGIRKIEQIRERLQATWQQDRPATLVDFWRRRLSLSVTAMALVLAIVWNFLRRRRPAPPPAPEALQIGPWLRAAIPGWVSSRRGRGGRTLFAVFLPTALVAAPLLDGVYYRLPVGYDPAGWLPWTLVVLGLSLTAAVRLRRELKAG